MIHCTVSGNSITHGIRLAPWALMVRLAAPGPVMVMASWIPTFPEDRAIVPATW
jgi:hypothetical protein